MSRATPFIIRLTKAGSIYFRDETFLNGLLESDFRPSEVFQENHQMTVDGEEMQSGGSHRQ